MATSTRRTSWGLGSSRDIDWRQRAACATGEHGLPIDAWSVQRNPDETNRAAAKVCDRCPVLRECGAEYEAAAKTHRIGMIAGGKWWDAHGVKREVPRRIRLEPVERPADGLLSVRDVATRAGCNVGKVYRAIEGGKLAASVLPGSGWRIHPEDLDDWLTVSE